MTKLEILRCLLKRSIFVAAVTLIVTTAWANAATVDIDVKPGSDPNCFNNDGHGVIPVAILTTDVFDATDVDPTATLVFGPADGSGMDLMVKTKGNGEPLCGLDDFDNDGDLDLVCHFEDEEFAFDSDVELARIDGETFDGIPITGDDSVCIVP